MVKSLECHVAVVTGAAKGIGKATAQILADRGAAVACWDIQEEGLKRTAEEINASGGKTFGFMVDVTENSQVQQAVKQTVDALGVIDILVNNAGGTMDVPPGIDDLTEEGWDKVVSLNMRGPFLTCKAVVGMMKEKGWGRIINIASGAGRSHSRSGVIPYAAGKAGLLGFTRQLAVELAPHGINVPLPWLPVFASPPPQPCAWHPLDLPHIGGRLSACVFSLLPRACGVRSFRCAEGAGE